MKNRILSLILAFSFLISLVPTVRAEETDALPTIEEQIRAYADSIDQSDAESTAALTLATHGITGGGKTLKLGAGSALTAVLFNSELLQHVLTDTCTAAITSMQQLDRSAQTYTLSDCGWKTSSSTHTTWMMTVPSDDMEDVDWALNHEEIHVAPLNDYDHSLEWMAGAAHVHSSFERTLVSDTAATYRVTVTVKDTFDFDTASSSGFKKFISSIGMLLFREYAWESSVTFELTVPYSCPHSSKAYRLTYDAESKTMTSDTSGGYTRNNAHYTPQQTEDGTLKRIFTLEETVRLYHDRPWVLEYDVRNPGYIALSPVEQAIANSQATILHTAEESLFLRTKDYNWENHEDNLLYIYYQYYSCGTQLRPLFDYRSDQLHTFRLENAVSDDGSNCIYLTVTNQETGEVCLDRVAMNDHYLTIYHWQLGDLVSEESDWASGRDLYINYIGNQIHGFRADHFELRIWENGIGGESESYYRAAETVPTTCTQTGYTDHVCAACGHTRREYGEPARGHRYETAVTAPTCTEPGFTVYTCDCGDSYISDHTDALGHDPTEWMVAEAPTCTESGIEERWCRRCGHRESRTADPLGHAYESVIVEPQCTEGGYTLHTCSRCGDSYRTDFTGPRGHLYEAAVTEPGCTEGGYTTYTCACGDSYKTNYTSPLGHSYEAAVKEPSCTEGGSTTHTCTACGSSYTTAYTGALGHDAVVTVLPPTCTEGGYTLTTCTRCDLFVCSDETDATGHHWSGTGCVSCGAVRENPFTDVPENAFYIDPVLWAVEQGITSGATETTFNPNGDCLRAQVVTFLWRAAGCPEPTTTENPFADVKETDFFYKAVLWAVENGITNGADATHFNPTGDCNRAQVVTFLYRAFASPAVSTEGLPFTDVPAGAWYESPIAWAVEQGITNGLSATQFGPNANCNRAQVVTFLYRAYN